MLIPDIRSDHAPFWYQGSWRSAIDGYGEFAYAYYHQPSDTPATLDKPFFTGAAQIVVNATTMLLESRDRNPAIDFSSNSIRNCSRYQLLAELPKWSPRCSKFWY